MISSEQIVVDFAAEVRILSCRLIDDFKVASAGEAMSVLLSRVRSGLMPRSGQLDGAVGYAVHGGGCRFSMPDGVSLDLDVDVGSGVAAWDAWRVREFAVERGEAVDLMRIEDSLLRLGNQGRIAQLASGWFALVAANPSETTGGS